MQGFAIFGLLAATTASPATGAAYTPYSEARPVFAALPPDGVPEPFRGKDDAAREALWTGWVEARDREIRARLAQGAEDSVAHLMLFGTSFTREPRATIEDLGRLSTRDGAAQMAGRLTARIHDLAEALANPGSNERLAFARGLVSAKGLDPGSPSGRAALERYLYDNLRRVLREDSGYAKALGAAKGQNDPTAEFAERSTLFRARGLSSDTSLLPNLALEESLLALKEKRLLAPGSVKRVAVVGPGLDFTDKRDGYDFYPEQTIQPFAIVDSLLRLGLARGPSLEVVTYDLNPQVNDHVRRAAAAARRGRGYVVQLPWDAKVGWMPAAVRYWQAFGDRIGAPVAPVPVPPPIADVKTRAVRIRPEVVSRLRPGDLDIVLQRPVGGEPFDLVIATNIFVYYDTFEQCLALANVAAMLRPGAFLLSNNALLELPGSRVRSVGYKTTVYSDRPDDGDHVVWYRRLIE